MVKLSRRLALVAKMAEDGRKVADIGTDHGFIPAFFAEKGGYTRLCASDLRPGPLASARQTAREHGVEGRIAFVLADGLLGLDGDFDTLILAGMGGELMVSILSAAPWALRGPALVLQPQSKTEALLPFLAAQGLSVTRAALVEDGDKLYQVYRAEPGAAPRPLTGAARYGLDVLRADPLFPRYVGELRRQLTASRDGLRAARCPQEEKIAALERLLEEIAYVTGH